MENDDKTDKKMFVGGINCSKQNAYEEMIAVQRRFGMKGKVVAYHGIQSFRHGEVTPEEAFEIGKETARRMWGDRYQVLVTVHLNTQSTHCHMVANPCSFVDGQKFKNKIGDHLELRKISDAVCREHGLSVLENSDFYTKGKKKEYWAHKSGQLTHRDMLKRDMEYCLKYSSKEEELEKQLYGLGYKIDWQRMSVIGKGWDRAVRLKNIGITDEVIDRYFEENRSNPYFGMDEWNTHLPIRNRSAPIVDLMRKLDFTVDHSNDTAKVVVSAVFYIVLALFEIAKTVKDYAIQSHELRYEARNIEKFVSEYKFLRAENIDTLKDLKDYIDSTEKDIAELESKRQLADNKKRRAKTPEETRRYKDERKEVTNQIAPLRKKLKQAKEILDKSPRLYALIKLESDLERGKQPTKEIVK